MNLRETNLNQLHQHTYDVLIVGAGINGAVSAAALSKKGLSVAVIDKGDFAGETSSHSSNLAWGGI
ncbi:MAG: FAD-dependent oxidoreductase, partial [Glaciecola sp.]|nr:FAD-dependent oxidoreductase [Glaciecola sp.]